MYCTNGETANCTKHDGLTWDIDTHLINFIGAFVITTCPRATTFPFISHGSKTGLFIGLGQNHRLKYTDHVCLVVTNELGDRHCLLVKR